MANSNSRGAQPSAAYEDLRFADGSHTGVRVDRRRLVIEVQRRGRRILKPRSGLHRPIFAICS